MARNANNPAWGKLEANWRTSEHHAAGVVAAYQNGRPSVSWEVQAATEVLRLARLVQPREALTAVAAMVPTIPDELATNTLRSRCKVPPSLQPVSRQDKGWCPRSGSNRRLLSARSGRS
jgi:hypothetical protein